MDSHPGAILIVDDHEPMRLALQALLAMVYPGAAVSEACDGAGALGLCRERSFQIVLLDIGLPDASGFDLIAPIRRLLPGVAVIVVSQHREAPYAEHARIAGALAFVAKERIYEDLLPAIAAALGPSQGPGAAP